MVPSLPGQVQSTLNINSTGIVAAMKYLDRWRSCLSEALRLSEEQSTLAESHFRRALMLAQTDLGVQSIEAGIVLFELGEFLEYSNRHREAAVTRAQLRRILTSYIRDNETPKLEFLRKVNRAMGATVVILRCSQSLSCDDLAQRSNINVAQLRAIEAGRKSLRIVDMRVLAEVLCISPANFLAVSEYMFQNLAFVASDESSLQLIEHAANRDDDGGGADEASK
jgi:DNA-binding transcriptional regulator YiaG